MARHLGETHGVAIEIYLKYIGESEEAQMRVAKPKTCIGTGKMYCRRLRISKYSREAQGQLVENKRTVVEVMNEAPAVIDLKNNTIVEGKECQVDVIKNVLPSELSSRLLVHGRNSVAWNVGEEEYNECGMDWIRKAGFRNINEFEDLTVGEKQFFCLWNQFMFEKGYFGNIGRIHMNSVLVHFVEEMGRQVVEENLYRQLVIHLVQLERDTVIDNSQLVNLIRKLQQV